ncbi:LysR family transcriptional regulator [Deinococcus planocerae]|uniref:LysR family transcriptional regulator n=1 Tax=Deinococcus planocerae TaxID=1737569 RepID=UPI000C7EB41F|nr:LysR family transcriptional regulator [Deinococcus planocerae]
MRDVDLRKLHCFVVVAEEGHLTRAAERLHLAQPPLSRLIKGLEGDLGVELFVRCPHGLTLTPAGEALLDVARHTLDLWRSGLRDVRRVAAEETRVLRLALPFVEVGGHPTLWAMLRAYHARRPDSRLELVALGGSAQDAALTGHHVDVGIQVLPAPVDTPPSGLEQLVLPPERLRVMLAAHDPRAGWSALPIGSLADDALLSPSPELAPGAIEQTYANLRRLGLASGPARHTSSMPEGFALVALGEYVSLLYASLGAVLPSFPVVLLPLVEHLTDDHFVLRWRRGTPAAQVHALLTCARQVLGTLPG